MSQTAQHNLPFHPLPAGTAHAGISQRDWFAAMALQGLVTKGLEVTGDRVLSEDERNAELVRRSYKLADSMLAGRVASARKRQPAAT